MGREPVALLGQEPEILAPRLSTLPELGVHCHAGVAPIWAGVSSLGDPVGSSDDRRGQVEGGPG